MSEKKSALRLYNTLTKKEEIFSQLEAPVSAELRRGEPSSKHVTVYTCGPTVYGRPHIGNYASFLMADLLVRWLEAGHGYGVIHAKNITDVGHLVADMDEGEDKIEKQAKMEKVDPLAIARKYEAQYLEDEKLLNMREPQFRPRATDFIQEMIAIVKKLLQDGTAYETNDGVYFSVTSFPAYGELSGNTLSKLDAGARVDVNEEKKHPADFALWKKCTGDNAHHLLRWNFETGERSDTHGDDASSGFPGWHIECSAMSAKCLGEQIDIHTGGEDNIFPHHECEIAQSESFSGKKPFVQIWLHRRRIDIGEQKMSKSLGNVRTLPDILASGYSAQDLRYYLLSVHYRTNLKFSERGLDDAKKARRKICEWIFESDKWQVTSGKLENKTDHMKIFQETFSDAMNADLNVSQALAVIFDCMNESRVRHEKKLLHDDELKSLKKFQDMIRKTFACFENGEEKIPDDVQKLLDERKAAREKKDFAASDRLRDAAHALGYEVRDSGATQTVKKL